MDNNYNGQQNQNQYPNQNLNQGYGQGYNQNYNASNNYNQNYNQTYNTGYNQNYNQVPQQTTYQQNYMGNQPYSTPYTGAYDSAPIVLTDTRSQQPNLIMGIVGALLAGVIATFIWIFITASTGTQFALVVIGLSYAVLILYNKFAKGMDIVGLVICSIIICICIYFANRYSCIYVLVDQFNCTVEEAADGFDLVYDMYPEIRSDYIFNMILSYVIGGVCVFSYLKKSR